MTKTEQAAVTVLSALLLAACAPGSPTDAGLVTGDAAPSWIWAAEAADDREWVFRRTFRLADAPDAAVVAGTCDNHMVVLINGEPVGTHAAWEHVVARDVAEHLAAGDNTLAVRARNEGGPAGLALRLDLGGGRAVVTDRSWQVATDERAAPDAWADVAVLGAVGAEGLPWSGRVTLDSFLDPGRMTPGAAGGPQAPEPAADLHLLPGYEAELVYTVPGGLQGSWVALTADPRGRLYASDERDRGLYRVTPAALGEPDAVTHVERVPLDVSGAQGLCWAFGSLYANVSGEGLWRLRDTDGDDELDDAELLVELDGSGEHGPHAVIVTEDGEGLYFVGGNHTLPPDFEVSRAPSNWAEDLLLPRRWDPSGHARGRLAPGGWIARCDPDGAHVELVSTGYRNPYDVALGPDGELFTYDADMEWDLGLPWYRPTRLCHVTSGSEFGWRGGTGKWPTYYEDSLPPVLNLGPGSPTGLLFGTGLAFPARYRQALFALDWTFGTIYALHLEPAGSSYTATAEEFVWAEPLALTDATVGGDGALYFTVGGRGTQSSLYRVRYVGSESTARVETAAADAGASARDERRALEAFHGRVDPDAVDAAWPALASADRCVRFAARIAVENQPVATWRARALAEADPRARVVALVALARQGEGADRAAILRALGELDLAPFEDEWLLIALRAYALAFARLGEPGGDERAQVLATLDALFPADSAAVDAELVRLSVYLDSPTVVADTLALMRADGAEPLPAWSDLVARNDTYGRPIAKMLGDMPPVQDIAYAFLLRNATEGWTLPRRREYFEFFVAASAHPGGHSYAGFLEDVREEAASHLTPSEERSLAELLGVPLVAPLAVKVTPPVGPGRTWTLEEAIELVGGSLAGRDFASGQNLYHATSCSLCHRFDGQGGALGPDLTSVAGTFSVPDLLEAIVEPSNAIPDQYGSHRVVGHDGNVAVGMVVEGVDDITVYPRSASAPPTVFGRSQIASIEETSVSSMPAGLVDRLNPEELKDLVAYLLSGGDPEAAVFLQPPAGGSD